MSIYDVAPVVVNRQTPLTLASGTKAVSDSNVTTSSKAWIQLVTPGGTLGANYKVVCTAGNVTVTSVAAGGTTQILDTSTVTVFIVY